MEIGHRAPLAPIPSSTEEYIAYTDAITQPGHTALGTWAARHMTSAGGSHPGAIHARTAHAWPPQQGKFELPGRLLPPEIDPGRGKWKPAPVEEALGAPAQPAPCPRGGTSARQERPRLPPEDPQVPRRVRPALPSEVLTVMEAKI